MSRIPRILIVAGNPDAFQRLLVEAIQPSNLQKAIAGERVRRKGAWTPELAFACDEAEALQFIRDAEAKGARLAGAFVEYRESRCANTIELVQSLLQFAREIEIAVCTSFGASSPADFWQQP